ncbi:hypothetical protein ONA92_21535 [Mycobacteroides salmoniphilum]|uniref:DUF7736 domain-containing protein n=1 Tax=Mycobacteroides salmoniphilum TaxID=404941 RepID=UPI00356ABDDB
MSRPHKERFPLAAVLTIAAGLPEGALCNVREVQALLGFMTGGTITINQVPRARDFCQKFLLDQHGWLEALVPESTDVEKVRRWGTRCEKQWGKEVLVEACPGDAYRHRSSAEELQSLWRGRKVAS